ncbi:MAG TPA: GxxExxY protein [Chthoniobacterales bacterium]
MKEEALTHELIGSAMEVLNALKPGLDEKLYERALVLESGRRNLRCDAQRQYPVFDAGQNIGTLIPDLIVEDRLVVDAKVVSTFNDTHIAQMMGYLAITGLPVGLLLNFKNAKLEWKRNVK